MVVIRTASVITRCLFSKKLIKSQNKVCLFNEEQYAAFKKNIYIILNQYLPYDIIEDIIKATNYEKYIGRFGHEKITHWTIKFNNNRKILLNKNYETTDSEEIDSEESEFDDLEEYYQECS
jgi:hypothetical protein